MNRPAAPTPADIELLHARFARRCTARLSADKLPHDVTERLRAAREQALAAHRAAVAAAAPASAVLQSGGAAVLGGGSWRWLGAGAMLLALAAASMLIAGQPRPKPKPAPMPLGIASTAARPLDVALLTDPLPPHAYADPGFIHFLRQTATNPDMAPPGERLIAPARASAPASAQP